MNEITPQPKEFSTTLKILTVIGIVLDFLAPLFGIIIGIYLITRKTIQVKKAGMAVIVLGAVLWGINIMILMGII